MRAASMHASPSFWFHPCRVFVVCVCSSQYMLLQYGFVPMNNPHAGVEVTTRLRKKDALFTAKRDLLKAHGLDARQRNFLFLPHRLDPDLLAATRIQVSACASQRLVRSSSSRATVRASFHNTPQPSRHPHRCLNVVGDGCGGDCKRNRGGLRRCGWRRQRQK